MTRICLLLMLVITVQSSWSEASVPTSSAADISRRYETIYWSQLPTTGTAHASQYFPELYPTFDCGVANDFQFTCETWVNRFRWWGGYWGGIEPVPVDAPVEIYIYLDDGTGESPTLPQHTSAVSSWFFEPGEYSEILDGDCYMVVADLDMYVIMEGDVHYWLEVRKAFPVDPYGLYGWIGSEPVVMSTAVQGYDGIGVDWWTPIEEGGTPVDVGFELVWREGSALQQRTWGGIKVLF